MLAPRVSLAAPDRPSCLWPQELKIWLHLSRYNVSVSSPNTSQRHLFGLQVLSHLISRPKPSGDTHQTKTPPGPNPQKTPV